MPDDWIVTGDADFKGCDDPGNGHHDFVSWLRHGPEASGSSSWQARSTVCGSSTSRDRRSSSTRRSHPYISAADREELDQVVASIRFVDA